MGVLVVQNGNVRPSILDQIFLSPDETPVGDWLFAILILSVGVLKLEERTFRRVASRTL
jgi:hypothetical protein